jgi:2-polyprenyl-3-methyl-5-hydroxy-6-metoxy-1,4-benzoquinol methylase
MTMQDTQSEIERRFAFGENWLNFLAMVDDERIAAAEASLKDMLDAGDLRGRRFLDVGAGSGLFSLAARNLGAVVHSFDYDTSSVAATTQVRDQYCPGDSDWIVEQGSVLDGDYLRTLGRFDVVYAWGVLHHTGAMWGALDNVADVVSPDGRLFLSIYNDQGLQSRVWKVIKRQYNDGSPLRQRLILASASVYFGSRAFVAAALRRAGPGRAAEAPRARGMSRRHDLVDWVGGYPFEVAKPEEVFDRLRHQGFRLLRLKTCGGGLGCNEFVFEKPG